MGVFFVHEFGGSEHRGNARNGLFFYVFNQVWVWVLKRPTHVGLIWPTAFSGEN